MPERITSAGDAAQDVRLHPAFDLDARGARVCDRTLDFWDNKIEGHRCPVTRIVSRQFQNLRCEAVGGVLQQKDRQ
jgi:hypothetical protein